MMRLRPPLTLALSPFLVGGLLVGGLLLGGFVPVPGRVLASRPEAAISTRATLTMSTYRPIVRESFVAAGRVSTRFSRPVALRVRSGGSWTVVRRARVARSGVYRIRGVRTTTTRRYDVVVAAARHGGHRYTRVVTRFRVVRPVRQTATISVLPQVAQRGTRPAG